MAPESKRTGPGLLFLTYGYPSFGGTGSQIRSAALLRMLANDWNIHLVIVGDTETVSGPKDQETEALCGKLIHLRVSPGAEAKWRSLPPHVGTLSLPTIDCLPGETAERILRFYEENKLECLFVFRFEALMFVSQRLNSFPIRHIDLDELPSRREAQVSKLLRDLEIRGEGTLQRTQEATLRIMEKAILPKFHRVYVSSSNEGDEVRRRTGFQGTAVLPNIYPLRARLPEQRTADRDEILFVGSLSYVPNIDAVLFFCREILPLIRAKKGERVIFRIVGVWETKTLRSLLGQPGVELTGYQENLAPLYAKACMAVVPLRAGSGTRLKILEAFAYRRVVISTSIGAEGLEVTNRKNIILADDATSFAEACIEMIDQPELATKICDEASLLHRERYSEEALLRCYRRIETTKNE